MSIRISPKHGVNPAIPKCFFCQEDKNQIILAGHLRGDAEAPKGAAWDREPCDKCKEYMKIGIILISVKDGESGDNPYRTGGWVVVKEEMIKRMQPPEFVENLLKTRMAYIPNKIWEIVGLPQLPGNSKPNKE